MTRWEAVGFFIWLGILVLLLATPVPAQVDGEFCVRATVRISIFFYAPAVWLFLWLRMKEPKSLVSCRYLAGMLWSLACAAYLIHVGLAFHYYDRWSHEHAIQRTAALTGFGRGLYVSYAFTAGWAADVAWLWSSWQTYWTRPAKAYYAVQGFMAFMVFNGTVVFETSAVRYAGLVLYTGLAVWMVWCQSRRLRTTGPAKNSEAMRGVRMPRISCSIGSPPSEISQ